MKNRDLCKDCRFFETEEGEHQGLCRKNAPSPFLAPTEDALRLRDVWWPIVFDTDWCGDWEGKDR